jgi:hypothetical protein
MWSVEKVNQDSDVDSIANSEWYGLRKMRCQVDSKKSGPVVYRVNEKINKKAQGYSFIQSHPGASRSPKCSNSVSPSSISGASPREARASSMRNRMISLPKLVSNMRWSNFQKNKRTARVAVVFLVRLVPFLALRTACAST